MTEKLQRKEISTAQIIEALDTVPLKPFTVAVTLCYNGMYPYSHKPDAYLDACKKHSIIPIKVNFEYDHNLDEFFVKDFQPVEMFYNYQNASTETRKGVYNLLAHCSHKQISVLSYKIGPIAHTGLKTLVSRELSELLESEYFLGYKFHDLDVIFSENSLDRPDTQMLLMGKSLELRVGSCITDEDAAKLGKWFEDLQKKYEK